MWPNRARASWTAASTWSGLVTSRVKIWELAAWRRVRSLRVSGRRAVATTLAPRVRRGSASRRPKPEDAPGMNQTLPSCEEVGEVVMEEETLTGAFAMQGGGGLFLRPGTFWFA